MAPDGLPPVCVLAVLVLYCYPLSPHSQACQQLNVLEIITTLLHTLSLV